MQASASGSAVSLPTLITRPKYAANSSPHSACRPDSRANFPPSQPMIPTQMRLTTTSTVGTRWCWPNERIQATIGYPSRVYR